MWPGLLDQIPARCPRGPSSDQLVVRAAQVVAPTLQVVVLALQRGAPRVLLAAQVVRVVHPAAEAMPVAVVRVVLLAAEAVMPGEVVLVAVSLVARAAAEVRRAHSAAEVVAVADDPREVASQSVPSAKSLTTWRLPRLVGPAFQPETARSSSSHVGRR